MSKHPAFATMILFAMLVIALSVSCGGDTKDTDDDSGTSQDEAFCEKIEQCPQVLDLLNIGSSADCAALYQYVTNEMKSCVANSTNCSQVAACLAGLTGGGGGDDDAGDDDGDDDDDPFDDDVPEGYDEGERLPNFKLTDSNGATVKLYDYAGRVVLLDSSAMWCPPCQTDTPKLETDFWEEYRDEGDGFAVIQLLGENYSGSSPSQNDLANWVGKYNLTFPVVADTGWQVGGPLGNGFIPLYTTLDQDMIIRRIGNNLYSHHSTIRGLLGIN